MGKGGQLDKVQIASDTCSPSSSFLVPSKENNDADPNTTAANTTNDKSRSTDAGNTTAPWYIRGGMDVNMPGMCVNVAVPPIFLAFTAATTSTTAFFDNNLSADYMYYAEFFTPVRIFAALFLVQAILAYAAHGMRTTFCLVAVPCYMTSILVLPFTLQRGLILPCIALAIFIAAWRVGVCMSVCLHRYAAHGAFKCGRATQFVLNVLGCAAHQGGPIWWASMHRCHHKYCDVPRDPHSAIIDGVENAFSFFHFHQAVDEEFAPRHNDTWYLRLLDTWAFSVCTAEMLASYHLFGREGLFVAYTSIWICQTITLWFNIANHPEDAPGKVCKAANYNAKPAGWYPAFLMLDLLYPYFGVIVSEMEHEDHHKHFMLAKRDSTDCAYFSFVWPMQMLGLIWDVKVAPPE